MTENKVLVLYYHKVIELKQDWNCLSVTPQEFRMQMEYIKKHYHVIDALSDFEKNQGKSIVITFDDGYEDNLLNALPILEEMEIPATFFVSTGMVGSNKELWHDEIIRLILTGCFYPEEFVTTSTVYSFQCATKTIEDRANLYKIIRHLFQRISNNDRILILYDLQEWANMGFEARPTHKALSVQQLNKLAHSPLITIGAHTVNHPSLGLISRQEQYDEIAESKQILEEWLEKKITLFSYPFGGSEDYTEETIKICGELRFAKAMTTRPQIIKDGKCNPYEVPRVVVQKHTMEDFEKLLDQYFIPANVRVGHSASDYLTFEYIGKMEYDTKIFQNNVGIMIWGAGGKGKNILDKLRKFGLDNQVILLCDGNEKKVGTQFEGFTVCGLDRIAANENAIVILAFNQLESALRQIETYSIKHIHYYF